VFIPKNGKDRYDKPNSFRPISLSNYLLKGLERLVTWRIEEGLKDKPIHTRQHGFRHDRSTETAISNTTDYIEQAFKQGMSCIGVFLDIKAAFDTIDPNQIRMQLLKHGAEESVATW
jgi:retron-type reverse transcriptase